MHLLIKAFNRKTKTVSKVHRMNQANFNESGVVKALTLNRTHIRNSINRYMIQLDSPSFEFHKAIEMQEDQKTQEQR